MPQPHPADPTWSTQANTTNDRHVELSSGSPLPPEAQQRKPRAHSSSRSNPRAERTKKHKSQERSSEKRDIRARNELQQVRVNTFSCSLYSVITNNPYDVAVQCPSVLSVMTCGILSVPSLLLFNSVTSSKLRSCCAIIVTDFYLG